MDSMDNLLPSDSASQVGNTSQASGVSASSSVSQKLQEEKRNLLTLQQKKGMLEQRRKLERDKLELRLREEEMDLEEKLTLSDAKVNSYQDELVNRTYVTLNSNSSRNLEPNLALAISNPFSDISSITPKNPFLQDTNPFRQNITYSTTPPAIDFTNLPPVDNTFNATEQLLYQLKMPAVEIKKFGGDPIEYRRFLRQFRTKILKYTLNPDEKMNYLEQYTFDQPNRIVRGYSYLDAHNGFESVMREFESKYGDPEILATSYVNKALGWPFIKEDDGKALEDFGIFLAECEFAVLEIDSLKVLDYSENLKKLVLKLPPGLFERWRGIVQNLKDFGKQPSFQDLVKFVKREGRKAVDPTYGKSALSSSSSKQKDHHSDKPKRSSHQTFVTTSTVDNRIKCEHCKNVHNIANCDKLKQLSHDDKINVLKKLDLCFACFKPGHLSTGCTARLICGLCKKHHPTILHNDNWIPKHSSHKSSSNLVTNATALPAVTRAGMCTMPVIPVCVQGRNNSKTIFTYALMDPGSSACFCTEQVVKELGICAPKASVSLQTIHGTQVQSTYMVKDLKVYAPDLSDSVNIPLCYTTVSIPVSKMSIPTNQDIKHWSHLTGIIPNTYNCEIGMIIGNNIPEAYSPYEFRIGPRGSPHASRTPLGWVVWNLVRPGIANDQHVVINRIEAELLSEVEHLKSLEVLVKKGFNHDFPESVMFDKDELSRQDKQFLEKAKNSTVIKDNHYEIGLPIKNECVILPDNSSVALNRLVNLKKKFTKDPPFQKEYATLVESLISNGYAEEVKDGVVNNTQKWIIPHHAVLHKKKKKYRVVFDCSSKYQGVSLNDHLLQGPDLTNTLVGVLLRFRLGRIAFTADIEAMFHQVKVPERDRDLLRFLWWPGGDMDIKPKLYRMTSHLFGAVSSPSIASYALRRTALDNVELYSENVTSVILQDFYVDDCLHSMDNVNEAVVLVEKLVELCSLGGFHLHKWISNSPDVISNIPESECAIENPLLGEDDTIERALGVQWNVTADTLIYKISVQDQPATRRGLLSVISSIFDPLGLASPALLPAKCILQKLCASGCSWDEVVEEPLLGQWVKWLNDLPNLEGFKMPRCVKSKHQYEIATTEIHHFSDASETGFGVASYIRYTDVTGNISCSLILGKSRVCPLKKLTIPDKTDNYVKKRWRQVQYLSDLFWKRWLKEYLPSLQQRQKWLKPKDNVKVGDIVLLAEGNMRNSWILAKVLEVVLDKHGLVRVVTVQTKTSTLKRPIHKLCSILEAESA